ncbi:MAG: RNA polymerase II mediator complex subunit [Bogoriella megaspora]|nr:MAG: RNA polymerase II mediator complex subunit [Bogoriella megaspora]
MAPTILDEVDDSLRATIQNLYELIIQSHDHHGPSTHAAQRQSLQSLTRNLSHLSHLASSHPSHPPQTTTGPPSSSSTPQTAGIPPIPPEIINYVEEGRNPDIYTREYVESVQKHNQLLKGRSEAMARFRDVLGREMMGAMPETEGQVRRIVEGTGGSI